MVYIWLLLYRITLSSAPPLPSRRSLQCSAFQHYIKLHYTLAWRIGPTRTGPLSSWPAGWGGERPGNLRRRARCGRSAGPVWGAGWVFDILLLWEESQQALQESEDDIEGPIVTVESKLIVLLVVLECGVGQFEGDHGGECEVDQAVESHRKIYIRVHSN